MSAFDDDDFDDQYGIHQVLPVSETLANNPNVAPVSGEEYLQRVREEARRCPDILIATALAPYESNMTCDWLQDFNNQKPLSAPKGMDVMHEWQKFVLLEFEDSHADIETFRYKIVQYPMRRFPCGHLPVSVDLLEKNYSLWLRNVQHPPWLCCVVQLKQIHIHNLIHSFSEILEDEKISLNRNLTVWIYSILAAVDKTSIGSDLTATIRNILRQLCFRRCLLSDPTDTVLPYINILIILLGSYFGQLEQD